MSLEAHSSYFPRTEYRTRKDLDWLGTPPTVEKDISKTYEADIIVIGGGHSGLHTAWAAACGGASVIVVEEQREKGFKWLGEQIGHFNSKFLIERGLGPYDLDEVIAEFMKCNGQRPNGFLISQYVRNSGELVDAIMELIPRDSDILKTLNVHEAYGKPKYPRISGGYKTWAGTVEFRKGILEEPIHGCAAYSTLTEVNHLVKADSEKQGAKWFFGYSAQKLIQENDGRVCGCVAVDKVKGKYARFIGKTATVLAAGDFSGNPDMVKSLLDEAAEQIARRNGKDINWRGAGRRGMGHKLGIWAGGRMESAPRGSMLATDLGGLLGCPPFVYLNRLGKRFVNETVEPAAIPAAIRQPIGKLAVVFDANWMKMYEMFGTVNHGSPDFGRPEYLQQVTEDMKSVVSAGKDGYYVRHVATTERWGGTIYGAETLSELADFLGYQDQEKETFLSSIERYNEFCKTRCDLDFGRDPQTLWPLDTPPYYAYLGSNESVPVGLVSLAGLVTDNNMKVLNDQDLPIEGLYAVGNCLGGRYSLSYTTPVAGNTIGMAMTHGRVLGKYLVGQKK